MVDPCFYQIQFFSLELSFGGHVWIGSGLKVLKEQARFGLAGNNDGPRVTPLKSGLKAAEIKASFLL